MARCTRGACALEAQVNGDLTYMKKACLIKRWKGITLTPIKDTGKVHPARVNDIVTKVSVSPRKVLYAVFASSIINPRYKIVNWVLQLKYIVSHQAHVLRQLTFFFSSLLSVITFDLPRSCLVRTGIA